MKEYNGVIFEDYKEDCYNVYSLTSTFNDKHIYIGVSGDIIYRWKSHANTAKFDWKNKNKNPELYSWMRNTIEAGGKIKLSILKDNLSKERAFELETDHIKKCRDLGYVVLNKNDGGIGQRGIKISEKHRDILTNRMKNLSTKPGARRVYVKNIETGEEQEFESAKECSSKLSVSYCTVIYKCNKRSNFPYKGKLLFSYEQIN